ncbi:MAG: PilZ domain-containing protein [Candidatus Omnitrophota bacterium]
MAKNKPNLNRDERRRAERLIISLPVVYRQKQKSRWLRAKCKNVSGMGVGIFTGKPLTPSDKIVVCIGKKTRLMDPFIIHCEVMRSKKVKAGLFEAGLLFVKIEERDKFFEFICCKMVEKSMD